MARYKLDNPFPEYGYFGAEYFCDREQETAQLIDALQNGSNVTLMAPRRIGKTGLIHHVFERMRAQDKNVQCFYVDIFSTKTFDQMVQFVTNAVMGKLDTPSQVLKRKLSTFVSAAAHHVAGSRYRNAHFQLRSDAWRRSAYAAAGL